MNQVLICSVLLCSVGLTLEWYLLAWRLLEHNSHRPTEPPIPVSLTNDKDISSHDHDTIMMDAPLAAFVRYIAARTYTKHHYGKAFLCCLGRKAK